MSRLGSLSFELSDLSGSWNPLVRAASKAALSQLNIEGLESERANLSERLQGLESELRALEQESSSLERMLSDSESDLPKRLSD